MQHLLFRTNKIYKLKKTEIQRILKEEIERIFQVEKLSEDGKNYCIFYCIHSKRKMCKNLANSMRSTDILELLQMATSIFWTLMGVT